MYLQHLTSVHIILRRHHSCLVCCSSLPTSWLIIELFFSDLSSGLVTVSSCVTSAVPPHTPATPLTPMMSPCPPVMSQAARPEGQTITVTLPVTPLTTGDPMVDQRRHWWHIEEVNSYCIVSVPSSLEMCGTHICTLQNACIYCSLHLNFPRCF